MSALNTLIEAMTDVDPFLEADARAELAQLRATVAEQARQLEAARKVIERCSAYIGSMDYGENTKSYQMCDAWLAANPTPKDATK